MRNLKEKFRRPAFSIILFLLGILFLGLPFLKPPELPFLFQFVGRLHPLILHFPIVLIILTLLFEIVRRYNVIKISDGVVFVVLMSAAFSAWVSVGAGFFLFSSGDYSGNVMDQHFWAGAFTGTAIFATTGLFLIYWTTSRLYWAYCTALLLSNVAVAYTSHLGGSITHGQDYLTEHLHLLMNSSEKHAEKPESEMLVYDDMIVPIFEAKCLSCHNAIKAKGNFRMTSYQDLLKGGESDLPSITPSVPEKSELINRVILPESHKDRMPPEGKTPMNEREIHLLTFWIESGATEKLRVEDIRKDKTMASIVESILPELSKYRTKSAIADIKLKTLRRELDEVSKLLHITINQDTLNDEDRFNIAMKFPPAPFTNAQFRELSPYFEVFSKASLVSSGIDDDGLYYIGQMVNLEALYLQKTSLDGSGLVYLQNLKKLKILNLSFTKVDDKAAIDLLKIPNLAEVYLYRTNTSAQVVDALQKNRPGLKILLQEGPYF